MFCEKMFALGSKSSVIRELFEYGRKRALEIGDENVYDFTIGNPSIPAPDCVKEAIIDLIENTDPVALHGYTSAQGDIKVRTAVAEYTNETFGTNISSDNVYMTSGAAASLRICFEALVTPEDEIITFAPYFPEYKVFVESAGAKFIAIPPKDDDFQIDLDKLKEVITENTKAVIINSPNNPSGVVYSLDTIEALCEILKQSEEKYGHPIYLVSDEPYRELVYDDVQVPCLMNYYKNTFICYSFSKSLSLPGERIGYIIVSNEMQDSDKVYLAICGAGRALGYVCASSMYQRVIARCLGATADVSVYKRNRDLLYDGLSGMGYSCVKPGGAFYLFVKIPDSDVSGVLGASGANAFCERAKKYEILMVPGDNFGCPGYVRIAYCVKEEQIVNSLPAFAALAKESELFDE